MGNAISATQYIAIISSFNIEHLADILKLEKDCFPASWQYPAAEEYYAAMLEDKTNINAFLYEQGKVIGYILAKPLITTASELKEVDPEILPKEGWYYFETIQILPEFQNKGGARMLLTAAGREALKKGISKFAIHARTSNGFNQKIKKIFSVSIILCRNIEQWKWADGEPYQYLEWEYSESDL